MYEYKLIRSKRKSIALCIDDNCEVVVRAPLQMPPHEVEMFVDRHSDWIDRHMPSAQRRMEIERRMLRSRDELVAAAEEYIPARVAYYSDIMGVKPTGIRITNARTRFGSCSAKNSLCFSFGLMLYPKEAIDCVVVHELAHIKHHNHSAAFYDFILKYMPDYRERENLLKSGAIK